MKISGSPSIVNAQRKWGESSLIEVMKTERKIVYFDEPGPQNTDGIIESVKHRLRDSEIKYVVVASESGNTALKVTEALKDLDVKVICVTAYAGIRIGWPETGKWPSITGDIRRRVGKLGVKIIEETPWIFRRVTFNAHFLKRAAPSWAIHEFVSRTMGYGLKTALEVALIAAEAGAVPIEEEVIAIAGTGWLGGGTDCAIIVKPSVVLITVDVENGLEVREIIAVPRIKFNHELIKKIKEAKETV